MPFDGRDFFENRALDRIDAVAHLLATERQWCKGSLQTPDGRHCLVGAMQAVHAQALLEPFILRAIRDVTGRSCWRIEAFNDRRSTDHAAVLCVLRKARERIAAGEPPYPLRPKRLRSSAFGRWLKFAAGWPARLLKSDTTQAAQIWPYQTQSTPYQTQAWPRQVSPAQQRHAADELCGIDS